MKEMSDMTRVVIASALSLAVIVAWTLVYRGSQPATPAAPAASPGAAATAAPTAGASGSGLPAATAVTAAVPASSIGDSAEKTIVIESDLYRVVLSNRGAVVRSWQLKKYSDAGKPPRQLDLVHSDAAQQASNWPFSLQLSDAQIEQTVNRALYQTDAATSAETSLRAPAKIEFRWSDGQTVVTKRLSFDDSYMVGVQTLVQRDGQTVPHRLAWRGGFGDLAVSPAERLANAFTGAAGSIKVTAPGSLGVEDQGSTPADIPGTFDVVGIEDHYFVAAFMPLEPATGQPLPAVMTLSGRQFARTVQLNGDTQQEVLPEIAAGTTTPGPQDMRVFVGPKDLDVLKSVRPPLDSLVQFGWFGFIAAPLFYALRWMHTYIPNYGWAIVLLTVAINTLLYPLTLKSWRSMQKMQKAAPEIKQIQDRYKKYAMRDPRKQEMNKEVMAVYAREGISPMGSCLPMVAQMPIWFGINRMLTVAIELRHAPWIGWITDLAARDPYYVMPVLMAVVMYVQQKMTPMTASDPAQQRMMNLMPLMMGGMFIFLPLSSGLVLYILTSNVIGVAQRWHLNRTVPAKAPAKRAAQ